MPPRPASPTTQPTSTDDGADPKDHVIASLQRENHELKTRNETLEATTTRLQQEFAQLDEVTRTRHEAAAVKIQALQRGVAVRRLSHQQLSRRGSVAAENAAATRIQCAVRQRMARREVRRRHAAANVAIGKQVNDEHTTVQDEAVDADQEQEHPRLESKRPSKADPSSSRRKSSVAPLAPVPPPRQDADPFPAAPTADAKAAPHPVDPSSRRSTTVGGVDSKSASARKPSAATEEPLQERQGVRGGAAVSARRSSSLPNNNTKNKATAKRDADDAAKAAATAASRTENDSSSATRRSDNRRIPAPPANVKPPPKKATSKRPSNTAAPAPAPAADPPLPPTAPEQEVPPSIQARATEPSVVDAPPPPDAPATAPDSSRQAASERFANATAAVDSDAMQHADSGDTDAAAAPDDREASVEPAARSTGPPGSTAVPPTACAKDLSRTFGRSATIDNQSPRKPKSYKYVPTVGAMHNQALRQRLDELPSPSAVARNNLATEASPSTVDPSGTFLTATRPDEGEDTGANTASSVGKLPPLQRERRKVRVTDDPVVVDLERRVRERRAAERKRQAANEARAAELDRRFKEQQAIRAEEAATRRLEEQQKAQQALESRMKYYEELQAQRLERLTGQLKIDPDVMMGKKKMNDVLQDRAKALKEQEERERQAFLAQRKQQYKMGSEFYQQLSAHEKQELARQERAASERQAREVLHTNPVPKEYITRAMQEARQEDEHERRQWAQAKEEEALKRQQRLAYAEEVAKQRLAKVAATAALVPPKSEPAGNAPSSGRRLSEKEQLSEIFAKIGEDRRSRPQTVNTDEGRNDIKPTAQPGGSVTARSGPPPPAAAVARDGRRPKRTSKTDGQGGDQHMEEPAGTRRRSSVVEVNEPPPMDEEPKKAERKRSRPPKNDSKKRPAATAAA